jgi:hypothetical protein
MLVCHCHTHTCVASVNDKKTRIRNNCAALQAGACSRSGGGSGDGGGGGGGGRGGGGGSGGGGRSGSSSGAARAKGRSGGASGGAASEYQSSKYTGVHVRRDAARRQPWMTEVYVPKPQRLR